MSFRPAPTKHHFISGAQKNTVLGPGEECANWTRHSAEWGGLPAGWFMNAWNLEAPADAAAPDISFFSKNEDKSVDMKTRLDSV